MLSAQQEPIDAHRGYDFYSLNIDAGGMWVRRSLDRMLATKNADRPHTTAPGS